MIPPLDAALHVNLVWFDEVGSTNDVAAALMTAWLAEEEERLNETVVVARTQSGGRGRGANTWESPRGGLYATWLAWLPLGSLAVVPLAVGVALAESVEALLPGVRVGLKWPNDLQVDGRKLGGVLCQSRSREKMAWVMAGFGVNVGIVPKLAPGDPVRPTSLRAQGLVGEPESAISRLLSTFLARIHGLLEEGAVVAAWMDRSVHQTGERMRLRLPAEVVEGRFSRLMESGEIELEVGGALRRFSTGEVLSGSSPSETGE
jgi:BirA family biotin operon repressor/biotin-[acetyl-CoA-carboxylase] ligase